MNFLFLFFAFSAFPFRAFVFVVIAAVAIAGQKYLPSNIPNSSRNKSTIRKICYRVKASWKLEFPFGNHHTKDLGNELAKSVPDNLGKFFS